MLTSLHFESRSFLPASALAALVLGLVLCPFIYVAIGALRGFEPVFLFVVLPLLLFSNGYLLFRFLGKPKERASSSVWLLAEILSWFVIAAFIMFISQISWFPLERIGMFLMFFLLASLFSLPVVLMRKTALQQRLMKLPNSVITLLLMLVVSISSAIVVVYLLTPNPVWR
jgi:hypothetical protein